MVNSEIHDGDKPSIMNSSRNPNTNVMDSLPDTVESGKDPAEFLKVPKNKRII